MNGVGLNIKKHTSNIMIFFTQEKPKRGNTKQRYNVLLDTLNKIWTDLNNTSRHHQTTISPEVVYDLINDLDTFKEYAEEIQSYSHIDNTHMMYLFHFVVAFAGHKFEIRQASDRLTLLIF